MPVFSLRQSLGSLRPYLTPVAKVLQWAGVSLLAAAFAVALHIWIAARPLRTASATVTETSAAQSASGEVVYTTHLRFRLPDGDIVAFVDPVQSAPNGDPTFATGAIVPVRYPEHHPELARIATVWRFYFIANVLAIFGVILADAGLVLKRWAPTPGRLNIRG